MQAIYESSNGVPSAQSSTVRRLYWMKMKEGYGVPRHAISAHAYNQSYIWSQGEVILLWQCRLHRDLGRMVQGSEKVDNDVHAWPGGDGWWNV